VCARARDFNYHEGSVESRSGGGGIAAGGLARLDYLSPFKKLRDACRVTSLCRKAGAVCSGDLCGQKRHRRTREWKQGVVGGGVCLLGRSIIMQPQWSRQQSIWHFLCPKWSRFIQNRPPRIKQFRKKNCFLINEVTVLVPDFYCPPAWLTNLPEWLNLEHHIIE
jgi:hypothetical protein